MENKAGFNTDELYYMRSSRKCTAWVWTRVFYPSTQDNSFPCSHSPQKIRTPGRSCYSRKVEEKEGKGLDSDLTEQSALPQPSFLHLS